MENPIDVDAITLFVEDLTTARSFYADAFGASVCFEDEVSTAFRLGNLTLNLLHVGEAHELVGRAEVAGPDAGSRYQLTLLVDDVDATCTELRERGVAIVSGPADKPWGRRVATFADPFGHRWEVAQELGA
jgi:uncharacterized glyoxalase superfamily protein PhnB